MTAASADEACKVRAQGPPASLSARTPKLPSRGVLKRRYLGCFRSRSPIRLRQTVRGLIGIGLGRELLLAWAVTDGHEKKWVSKLLSECFCALGLRQRRVGAGRRNSPPTMLLIAFA